MSTRHVSTIIAASPDEVYAFAAEPDNLVHWAGGLASTPVHRRGEVLIADSPMGEVTVTFAPRNDFGVLDHDVTLPNGVTVTNPMRVMAHPDGAEVVFTVRRLDMTEEQFERDVDAVAADLRRLQEILENR